MAALTVSIQKALKDFSLDLSFEAEPGCLAILGASGCGKSMTLRSIAGITTPDRGRIVLGGRVLFDPAVRVDLPPRERRVGYLFQGCALFPNMTVAENIAAGLRGKGRAQREETAARLAEQFRLGGLERRYPAQLSGGQRQRVALARILAHSPEAMLLDEPFSALDTCLREELLPELEELLKGYGGVSILVTHSREEAFRLGRRLMVLDQGRVSAFGETQEVFRSPGTVQAARLTGCRNIAAARPAGPGLAEVPEWGVTLKAAGPLPDGFSHIAIRGEDLHPAGAGEPNAIPLWAPEVLAGTGGSQVRFVPGPGRAARLWWEPGRPPEPLPQTLAVAPERVLPLVSPRP